MTIAALPTTSLHQRLWSRCRAPLTSFLVAVVTFGATAAWHDVTTTATKLYWDRYVAGINQLEPLIERCVKRAGWIR